MVLILLQLNLKSSQDTRKQLTFCRKNGKQLFSRYFFKFSASSSVVVPFYASSKAIGCCFFYLVLSSILLSRIGPFFTSIFYSNEQEVKKNQVSKEI